MVQSMIKKLKQFGNCMGSEENSNCLQELHENYVAKLI